MVPGITSAVAGLTYAGIPMTYRDGDEFHVFTAHLKDETEMLNWEAISELKDLVFLMGMKMPSIVQELTARGYGKDKPAAIVEWEPILSVLGGRTLGNIVELAEAENFKAPSVIVVGDVVAYRR